MFPLSSSVPVEEKVVRTAINECLPGGKTYQYFALNPWEASMRQEFAVFVQAQTASEAVAIDDGVKLLRLLNARYTARYPVVALPVVYENAVSVLHEHGWWNRQIPDLLQANDDEVQQVLNVLTSILSRVAQHHVPQPYSLLTKWLHFCFPDTFVIFDSQAANSIQTCSDFMHGHLGPQSVYKKPVFWQ